MVVKITSKRQVTFPKHVLDALGEGRLLLLSFFDDNIHRPTATLADCLLVAYAEQSGKIETLCEEALTEGKPVFALDSSDNTHLVACGVLPVRADDPSAWIADCIDYTR